MPIVSAYHEVVKYGGGESGMIDLRKPVTALPGIGDYYTHKLEHLGIHTIHDLLYHFPFRYEDYTKIMPLAEVKPSTQEKITVQGTIEQIFGQKTKTGKFFVLATINDTTGALQVLWWNQAYLLQVLHKGSRINLSGKIGWFNHKPTLQSPEWEIIKAHQEKRLEKPTHTARLVPIYPETQGVSSKWLRTKIKWLLEHSQLEKTPLLLKKELPLSILKAQDLIELPKALHLIHFPPDLQKMQKARKRLAFGEMLKLQLEVVKRKKEWSQKSAFALKQNSVSLLDTLPFELTSAQKRVTREISDDLTKNIPMNRLLQGDVGCGKTVVAAIAMFTAYKAGYQSALMAPTEVLAQQHFVTITSLLKSFKINISLHTSSKKTTFSPSSIFIGTHALLYKSVTFDKLGLVVIDEQHKFGVRQKGQLLQKTLTGLTPHVLTMTATPIPRSVALTLFGDQELSIIDEMPPGRLPVKTWVVPLHKRESAYKWVGKQVQGSTPKQNKLATGQEFKVQSLEIKRQIFIIFPLIDPSEHETMADVKAATVEYEKLQQYVFPKLNLGLLHGRLTSTEKERVVKDFRAGSIDILVSTSVVEVGVDIPNASIIVIENAERFGLASLHQLRGRVGRRGQQGYCLLMTDSQDPNVLKRLKAMERLNDGLKLAELDLLERGPGEVLGLKQHGFLDFKLANIMDLELIKQTRKVAEELVG